MKTMIVLMYWLLVSSFILKAGNSDSTRCNMKITEAQLSVGGSTFREFPITINDFRQLAPQSEFLKNDLSGFSHFSNYYYGAYSGTGIISGAIGINFFDKETGSYNVNPQIRIGFVFLNPISFSLNLNKTESAPYDTLTSSQTGQSFIVDSIHTKSYNMHYDAEQIRLSFSLIYRTNPARLASIYGGIGVTAGCSFYENTTIYYNEDHSVSSPYYYNNNNPGNYYSDNGKMEKFYNKSTLGFSIFLPVGLDLALGTQSRFWKRLHVFGEVKPEITLTRIPELKRNFSYKSLPAGIGIRYSWL